MATTAKAPKNKASAAKKAGKTTTTTRRSDAAAKSTAVKGAAKKSAVKKNAVTKRAAKKGVPKTGLAKKSKPKSASASKAPVKKTATRKTPARKQTAAKSSAPVPTSKNHKVAKEKGAASRGKTAEQPLMATLRAEHRHMGTVMQLFADQLNAIEAGELVDTHVVYEIIDYMVTWPDRFHHPREDLIYARVAELDGNLGDEVDTLQRDHDFTAKRGKEVLGSVQRWREGQATGTDVVVTGREYIEHIYEHMNLEEQLVFPHIEATLSLQDWRELTEDDQLQAVSSPVFGPQVQREFRNMTRKLRRSLRRGVERGAMAEWVGIEALMESLEVVSIAAESARSAAGEHLTNAVQDSWDIFWEAPLSSPYRLAANNTRVTMRILGEVASISRETFGDLSRVNQERQDRLRLLDRK